VTRLIHSEEVSLVVHFGSVAIFNYYTIGIFKNVTMHLESIHFYVKVPKTATTKKFFGQETF
jgi:hypothetical protein